MLLLFWQIILIRNSKLSEIFQVCFPETQVFCIHIPGKVKIIPVLCKRTKI